MKNDFEQMWREYTEQNALTAHPNLVLLKQVAKDFWEKAKESDNASGRSSQNEKS